MGLVVMWGHPRNSCPSMADHCFISSLVRGRLGRRGFLILLFIALAILVCAVTLLVPCRGGARSARLQPKHVSATEYRVFVLSRGLFPGVGPSDVFLIPQIG